MLANVWKGLLLLVLIDSFFGCAAIDTIAGKPKESIFQGQRISGADFSPDGTRIVFSVGKDKLSSIYRIDADGTNLTALSRGVGCDFDPVFSPDGKRIVFSSVSGGMHGNLYIMDADGEARIPLTTGEDHDYSPVFSKDGGRIYFLRAKAFRAYSPIAAPAWHDIDIYSIDIDGSNLARLSSSHFYQVGRLSLHPDESVWLARITEYRSKYSVWRIPIENGDEKIPVCPDFDENKNRIPLFSEPPILCDELADPQFSPDGKSMLFKRKAGELFVMDLVAANPARVLKLNTVIIDPRFSKENTRIVFSTKGPFLWIVDRDGSNGRNVLDNSVGFNSLTRRAGSPPPFLGSPPPSRRR